MNCHICHNSMDYLFTTTILKKYNVGYYQCRICGFFETEQPYWLMEAYSEAISSLDVGLVSRNIEYSNTLEIFIERHFNVKGKYLDYGGGYGLLVRLMRDKGFNFYRADKHCVNLFAQCFDISDLSHTNFQFDMLTAIEVFEHLEDPLAEVEKMFTFSNSIVFSTVLQPIKSGSLKDWWYLMPESGQHISFYSMKSLLVLAKAFGKNLYTDGKALHLLTSRRFIRDPLKSGQSYFARIIRRGELALGLRSKRPSLTLIDVDLVKTRFIN